MGVRRLHRSAIFYVLANKSERLLLAKAGDGERRHRFAVLSEQIKLKN